MARDLAAEQLWRHRINECRESGLSIHAWCLQNGVKNTTFHYWVKRLKTLEQQKAGNHPFAEVVLLPGNNNVAKQTSPVRAELSLSYGDYTIRIPDGFNPVTLAELVKVLQKL